MFTVYFFLKKVMKSKTILTQAWDDNFLRQKMYLLERIPADGSKGKLALTNTINHYIQYLRQHVLQSGASTSLLEVDGG